jgi:hypothetical protein
MIIVKLSNGNVILKDASGNVLKRLENHSYLQVVSSEAIEVYNNADKITTIYVSEVTGTQIEPAGVISFSGSVYDLMNILTTDFFFVSSGGSVPTSDGFDIIIKSANQDVLNNTLTDDLDFQFPVIAGGNYMLTMVLATSSSSSLNDYKFAFAVSSGTINGVGNIVCRNGSNSGTVTVISASSTTVTNSVVIGQNTGSIPNVSGIVTAIVDFGFHASADGILKFQFALNNGSTIARTWKGSVLKYKSLD